MERTVKYEDDRLKDIKQFVTRAILFIAIFVLEPLAN
jgi:hypothetical protein